MSIFYAERTLAEAKQELHDQLWLIDGGVVYDPEADFLPKKCSYIIDDRNMFSGLSEVKLEQTELGHLIGDGYVEEKQCEMYKSKDPYIRLALTYEGHKELLSLKGFKHDVWLATWRARKAYDWKGKELPAGYYICCDLALPDSCVCLLRTTCPEHKSKCHGSHD